ncbi:PaaI family thioesterase [Motiliproteus sp. SC1-56]|uniref:PaaI family thioesterase n=1 Tax=Motiliproteus sp. SC1-56 TaxID=2799565 RepID=UPI001A8E5227|nr:PaaI family thioesterase [Motiliproteus sp. SC1-56]
MDPRPNPYPHLAALEAMYRAGPIHALIPSRLALADGRACIEADLCDRYHHAAGAVHGAVYFKLLDEAAFFAAATLEQRFFLQTASFTTYFTRPVVDGCVRTQGRVLSRNGNQFVAEAIIEDEKGEELGRGSGLFLRSAVPLGKVDGYRA